MGEYMMGSIMLFGGTYAPKNWLSCEGQLLEISQHQALYAILGTNWGGDGRSTFALPDLRSRVPAGIGQGIGLSPIYQCHAYGSEINKLNISQMPEHTHAASFTATGGEAGSLSATAKMTVAGAAGNLSDPSEAYLGTGSMGMTPVTSYSKTKGSDTLATDAINVELSGSAGGISGGTVSVDQTGAGQPINNIQPTIGMRYIICIDGTFPSRN